MTQQSSILIVDDNEADRSLYKEFLNDNNIYSFHFYEAAMGKDAIELFNDKSPDCVLVDYFLPDMDGNQLVESLFVNENKTPVIMLTGQGDEEVAVKALKNGVIDYVKKNSITPETLSAVVFGAINQMLLQKEVKEKQEALAIEVKKRKEAQEELNKVNSQLEELIGQRTETLEFAIQRLEHANSAKSTWIQNVSYDLRTPLHALLGYAQILLSEFQAKPALQSEKEAYDWVKKIYHSAEQIISQISMILDFGKLESKNVDFDMKEQDINALIKIAYNNTSDIVKAKNINVTLPDATQCFDIQCDENRIVQVLEHLLSNAAKFSPENSSITCSLMEGTIPTASDEEPIKAITFSIKDEGVGVPDDEISSIFNTFEHSSRNNPNNKSIGLGLSISREIIAAHKGVIWATNNKEGKGLTVSFSLPMQA